MKKYVAFLFFVSLSTLWSQEQGGGETIYLVEPSSTQRFPEAPSTSTATLASQPQIPRGWYLQILTESKSMEDATKKAEEIRPLFSGLRIYVIVMGESYRLSVGPLVPNQLNQSLAKARSAGFTGAVLRRAN